MKIQEAAALFEVTPRTLRYYEEIGILQPERTPEKQRIYHKKDIARIRLILRGKKFGFSLEDIKEMIVLFEEDRTGEKQLERTIAYGEKRIAEVEEHIKELEELKADMTAFKTMFEQELEELRRLKKQP